MMQTSQPLADNVTGRTQRNPNCGDLGLPQISPIKMIDEHVNSVDGICAHPTNEKEFATCSHDRTIKIWDATKFTLKHDIEKAGKEQIGGLWSIAYDKQAGKTLVTASSDGLVRIWDSASGKCADTLKKHESFCYKAVFDNDGAYIASVGADRCMNYWDVRKTNVPVWTFADSPSTLMGVDFLPNDQKIVTTSLRGEISVFSVKRQQRIFFHETLPGKVEQLVADKKLAEGDNFSEQAEKEIRLGTNNTIYNVHALSKSPADEDCFFVGQLDGAFSKIKSDFDSCTVLQEFAGHSGAVRAMELNRTGDKVVSCCADHSLRIWDYARASA